jgi:hypothetical protein
MIVINFNYKHLQVAKIDYCIGIKCDYNHILFLLFMIIVNSLISNNYFYF